MKCASHKQGYASKSKAKHALLHTRNAQSKARTVYRCPMCGEWHMTKNRSRRAA